MPGCAGPGSSLRLVARTDGVVLLAELGHLIAFGIPVLGLSPQLVCRRDANGRKNHRVIDARTVRRGASSDVRRRAPPDAGDSASAGFVLRPGGGRAPVLVALIARLVTEERCLVAQLPGYAAYRTRVRYRLLPGVF